MESVYRETYRGFKSLILRQNLGNSPEVTSDENSYAEIDDSRTIPDMPISKRCLTIFVKVSCLGLFLLEDLTLVSVYLRLFQKGGPHRETTNLL